MILSRLFDRHYISAERHCKGSFDDAKGLSRSGAEGLSACPHRQAVASSGGSKENTVSVSLAATDSGGRKARRKFAIAITR